MEERKMQSINKIVLARPVANEGLKKEVKGGIVSIKQQTDLVPLTVLQDAHPSMEIKKGDVIFVEEYQLFNAQWGKKIMNLEGMPVLMVPFEMVVAVKK